MTNEGGIYKGVNIHSKTSGPTSICAKTTAIAQMVSNGGSDLGMIVAVGGWRRMGCLTALWGLSTYN